MNAALAFQALGQFFQRQVRLLGQPRAQTLARRFIDARRLTAGGRLGFDGTGRAHPPQQGFHKGQTHVKQRGNFALRFAALFKRQQYFPAQIYRIRRGHTTSWNQTDNPLQTTFRPFRFLLPNLKPL
jgi:hypothetical protein